MQSVFCCVPNKYRPVRAMLHRSLEIKQMWVQSFSCMTETCDLTSLSLSFLIHTQESNDTYLCQDAFSSKQQKIWTELKKIIIAFTSYSRKFWGPEDSEWRAVGALAPFLSSSLALLGAPLCEGFVFTLPSFTVERRPQAATMEACFLVPIQWKRVNSFPLNHGIKPFLQSDWINLVCLSTPLPVKIADCPRPRDQISHWAGEWYDHDSFKLIRIHPWSWSLTGFLEERQTPFLEALRWTAFWGERAWAGVAGCRVRLGSRERTPFPAVLHFYDQKQLSLVWWWMLTRLILVIISQHIQRSNYYVVHLKIISSYMSIISQLKQKWLVKLEIQLCRWIPWKLCSRHKIWPFKELIKTKAFPSYLESLSGPNVLWST